MKPKMNLRAAIQVSCYLFLFLIAVAPGFAQKFQCLQADLKANDVVGFVSAKTTRGLTLQKAITVDATLKKLRAVCRHGKLLDGRRREIRFYKLQGCWGNPPEGYLDIIANQQKELATLKKRFTVIEMTCNSGGSSEPVSFGTR